MTERNALRGIAAVGSGGETPDRYTSREGSVVHELSIGDLRVAAEIPLTRECDDPKGSWWRSYLAGNVPRALEPIGGRLRVADLFCGSGGLANGASQLCAELGVSPVFDFIADQDEEATRVFAGNHPTRRRFTSSVQKLVDYTVSRSGQGAKFSYRPELLDEDLAADLQGIDLVLAGPPCQGHSSLNNRTRRADPRNDLYLTVPAFAVAVGAEMCIIENVPLVLKDEDRVVETAKQIFESEGYSVTAGTLSASDVGWPQTRTRHFLVARKGHAPTPLDQVRSTLGDRGRSLWWAIGDLEDAVGDAVVRQLTQLSDANRARIDWLFDNDQYDLALPERPDCHRNGTTYTAVYGRLRKHLPAPTITTGFMSPGRGRFTHPTRRRTLTPQEAARLQGFPDTYRFVSDPSNPPGRGQLSKWIGDAVPMPLGYAAALSAFGGGLSGV